MMVSSRKFDSSRGLILVAVLALGVGCSRRQNDDMPRQGPATPENPVAPGPVVPQINPAKPAPGEMPGSVAEDPTRTGSKGAPGVLDTNGPRGDTTPNAANEQSDKRREAKATFKVATGYKLSGDAKLDEEGNGVKVVVDLEDAPPGKKGIHVHMKPDCSDIPGKSMGDHFAPGAHAHGLPPNPTRHLGDLGNLDVGKNGKAHFEFTVPNANLKPNDPMSFLNRALVIHESEDKGAQPSGNSGKPIACAVIEKD
jgi:Cu-Zn family superoxide dismutase